MISVIISTYNRKALLQRAIDSVLNQSYQQFELIIIDDCSSDGTERMVKDLSDSRIRYYKTFKNSGHDGLPKNVGIMNAKGDFIAFLDDDDHYRKDALKILHTYINHSGADVVYGDYTIDGKPGWSIDFSAAALAHQNFISMPTVMIRKEKLLAVGGFDQDVPKFKDWNLWLRLQKNGCRFLHIPIIVLDVSIQKESVTNKFEVKYDENGQYLPTFFNPADCKIYPVNTCLGKAKDLKVAVYTLTRNRLEYTKRMYEAMKLTAGREFDWFVVDQGSDDGTLDYIKDKTRAKIMNGKNEGLAKGWNQAIDLVKKSGEYDILIKIDNDAEMLTDNWLVAMCDLYERNRTILLSPYVEGLDGLPGGVLRARSSDASPYMLINDRVLGYVPNIGGIVFATPVELLKEWKFDESYNGNKDFLLCQYAKTQGYSIFYMEEFRVYHIDTSEGQKKKFDEEGHYIQK